MKCPNCGYIHGVHTVSTETSFSVENVEGKCGDFYNLPIKLERDSYYNDSKEVFGCPSCMFVFMGDS